MSNRMVKANRLGRPDGCLVRRKVMAAIDVYKRVVETSTEGGTSALFCGETSRTTYK